MNANRPPYSVLPFPGQGLTLEDLADDLSSHLLDRLSRHHRETYEHSLRVGRLASRLAEHLDYDASGVRQVTRAALLHDVGKVAVPTAILDKPDRLTRQEWSHMDTHCQVGADMLRRTDLLHEESYLVLHHHRWFAANCRLHTNYQPQQSKVIDLIAVCDAYDAITSDRPYSAGETEQTALDHLTQEAGIQFNPTMVKALTEMLDAEDGVESPAINLRR